MDLNSAKLLEFSKKLADYWDNLILVVVIVIVVVMRIHFNTPKLLYFCLRQGLEPYWKTLVLSRNRSFIFLRTETDKVIKVPRCAVKLKIKYRYLTIRSS